MCALSKSDFCACSTHIAKTKGLQTARKAFDVSAKRGCTYTHTQLDETIGFNMENVDRQCARARDQGDDSDDALRRVLRPQQPAAQHEVGWRGWGGTRDARRAKRKCALQPGLVRCARNAHVHNLAATAAEAAAAATATADPDWCTRHAHTFRPWKCTQIAAHIDHVERCVCAQACAPARSRASRTSTRGHNAFFNSAGGGARAFVVRHGSTRGVRTVRLCFGWRGVGGGGWMAGTGDT